MATAVLVISDEDRGTLESWTRSRSIRASHVERARIVLAVADGRGTSGTARQLGVSRPTVIKWRERFIEHGVAGLDDEPRPGRPKRVDDSAIIAATLERPPEQLAVTHWSSRLLAKRLGIGMRPSRVRGAGTTCSRGGERRSSSPPTRSWRPRGPTPQGYPLGRPFRAERFKSSRPMLSALIGTSAHRQEPSIRTRASASNWRYDASIYRQIGSPGPWVPSDPRTWQDVVSQGETGPDPHVVEAPMSSVEVACGADQASAPAPARRWVYLSATY